MLPLTLLGLGCAPGPNPEAPTYLTAQGEAFGSTWSVTWREEPGLTIDVGSEAAEVLGQIDARLSTWRPDSELQRARGAGGPLVVSEETWSLIADALRLAEVTGGAFDPTVEPLMELWGFRGKPRETLPSEEELAAARQRVGWQNVRLGRDPQGRPTLDVGGTALDVSALAPGHAADRVAGRLSSLGLVDVMVDVGGEIRAFGRGPRGAWRVGIEVPEIGAAPGAAFAAVAEIHNEGLATSGNYRRLYEVEGRRVVHTLDPRWGMPVESSLASVTVFAPDARTADGWATAMMVLGEDVGLPLLEQQEGLAALLLVSTEQGLVQRRSRQLGRRVVERASE